MSETNMPVLITLTDMRKAIKELVRDNTRIRGKIKDHDGRLAVLEGLENGSEELVDFQPNFEGLLVAFDAWPEPTKITYQASLSELCGMFRDWLAKTFGNVQRVNDQSERHNHQASEDRHRDAIVIIVDSDNPALDLVVDFCRGSSEGGTLRTKLQWHLNPPPYDWWDKSDGNTSLNG